MEHESFGRDGPDEEVIGARLERRLLEVSGLLGRKVEDWRLQSCTSELAAQLGTAEIVLQDDQCGRLLLDDAAQRRATVSAHLPVCGQRIANGAMLAVRQPRQQ